MIRSIKTMMKYLFAITFGTILGICIRFTEIMIYIIERRNGGESS